MYYGALLLNFIIILTVLFINLPHHVYSYCIYNEMTDGTRFYIRQTGGQGRHSNYFAYVLSLLYSFPCLFAVINKLYYTMHVYNRMYNSN